MNNYGGRRFILVCVCAAVYVALLVGGYIDQTTFRDLQVLTVGAYIAGNVLQKNSENKHGFSSRDES